MLAFGLAKMHEPISTLEQAQILSPLPALGVVPRLEGNGNRLLVDGNVLPAAYKPELVSFLQPLSPAAESYRALLTSILLSRSTPPGVIMMTSALPSEGKTTTAVSLSRVLARANRRVLVVDANLRRPKIQEAFKAGGFKAAATKMTDAYMDKLPVIPATSVKEIKERLKPFEEAGATRLVVPYVPVSEPVIEDARRFVEAWGNS